MGHFTIDLPDNRHGDVRWGKVRKLQFPFLWLTRKNRDEKMGYIIKVNPAVDGVSMFQLFKTKEGKWFQDPDERKQVEDKITLAIKDAIEKHEQTT
ncbi:hypothetical protein OCK74_19750 [Chitinophagaceae bacterium LB-8]|uniref:Uncharacterized protein n=1 Tax=Paraflavisolibacter caeni TaxID=2982496 RepID=A0A9X2XXT3_9BACT|nr:hypothetical protein [Paraflavisolibacter caeni]MCU7551366.1 hypothetical protein [Paraflavisolibacter caeni]